MFKREELLRDVWGFRSPVHKWTLDNHAHRLRHKLATAAPAKLVVNVRGSATGLCDKALLA